MSFQDYIAIFLDLTHRNDMRVHHSEIITRFVWSLRPEIRHTIITGSYDLNTVEEAFDVALKINLTFKTLVSGLLSVVYEHYDYQCPSESQHVRIVSSDDVDDSKVVEDVHVPPKTASIIEDLSVGFSTPIFDETYVSSDSSSDDVNELVESNIPVVPIK